MTGAAAVLFWFLVACFSLAYKPRGLGYLSALFHIFAEVRGREENGQELKAIDFFLTASFSSGGALCPTGRIPAVRFISCVWQVLVSSI